MSISKKMKVYFGFCSVVPVIVMAVFAYSAVNKPLRLQSANQLVSVRDAQKNRIENYFSTLRERIISSSEHQTIVDATKFFKGAFSDFQMKEGASISDMDGGAVFDIFLKDLMEQSKCEDVFLADTLTGVIVYSVRNRLSFATPLKDNPFSTTNLGTVFSEANSSNDPRFVKMSDFDFCPLLSDDALCFMASPIFEGSKKIGVLVFQISKEKINSIMNNNKDWKGLGLGKTGETYIVGDDYKRRSQSRGLLENKAEYFRQLKNSGVNSKLIETIRVKDSTVLLLEAKSKGAHDAVAGKTGVEIYADPRGVPVLGAYAPLKIEDVKWCVLAELSETEAFASVSSLRDRFLLAGGVLAVVAMIVVGIITRQIVGSLRIAINGLAKTARGEAA